MTGGITNNICNQIKRKALLYCIAFLPLFFIDLDYCDKNKFCYKKVLNEKFVEENVLRENVERCINFNGTLRNADGITGSMKCFFRSIGQQPLFS